MILRNTKAVWLLVVLFCIYLPGYAQEAGLQGDTIKVCSDSRPIILLPGTIRQTDLTYPQEYSARIFGKSVTISPHDIPGHRVCMLNVIEGNSERTDRQRQHTFIVVFVAEKEMRPSDLKHNYSTEALLRKRMQRQDRLSPEDDELIISKVQPAQPQPGRRNNAAVIANGAELDTRDIPASGPDPGDEATEGQKFLTVTPASGRRDDRILESINVGGAILNDSVISARTMQYLKDLSSILMILCNKHSNAVYNNAIKGGLTFFISDTCSVSISSLNRKKDTVKTIKKYLTDLTETTYSKVDIEWTNIAFVSRFLKNDDNTYSGFVQFEQKFTAYRDGRVVYSDRTAKNIEIILVLYSDDTNMRRPGYWDIKLSDISVKQTRKK